MRRFALLMLLLVVFNAYAGPVVSPAAAEDQDRITPPRVLQRVAPDFRACDTRRVANLEIESTISTAGTVEEIRFVTPAPPCMTKAAKLALGQWSFAPATRNGAPVAVRFHFEMALP